MSAEKRDLLTLPPPPATVSSLSQDRESEGKPPSRLMAPRKSAGGRDAAETRTGSGRQRPNAEFLDKWATLQEPTQQPVRYSTVKTQRQKKRQKHNQTGIEGSQLCDSPYRTEKGERGSPRRHFQFIHEKSPTRFEALPQQPQSPGQAGWFSS